MRSNRPSPAPSEWDADHPDGCRQTTAASGAAASQANRSYSSQRSLCVFGAAVADENLVDLGSLQALTHPLRLRLLSRLRTDGPATAAELGRSLGQSRGAMSYHLRQLERFGFVVDDGEVGDRRKRRWRATAPRSVLARGLLRGEPGVSDAVMAIVEAQIAPVLDALTWSTRPDVSKPWAEAFMSFDHELRLDAEQLLEMRPPRGIVAVGLLGDDAAPLRVVAQEKISRRRS